LRKEFRSQDSGEEATYLDQWQSNVAAAKSVESLTNKNSQLLRSSPATPES
jgi:hypothetical protein